MHCCMVQYEGHVIHSYTSEAERDRASRHLTTDPKSAHPLVGFLLLSALCGIWLLLPVHLGSILPDLLSLREASARCSEHREARWTDPSLLAFFIRFEEIGALRHSSVLHAASERDGRREVWPHLCLVVERPLETLHRRLVGMSARIGKLHARQLSLCSTRHL